MKLSIIVPVYNEGANLPVAIQAIDDACRRTGLEYPEVLIIDDGSTDGITHDIEMALPHTYQYVKCIGLEHNLGLGRAYHFGVFQSSGQFVMMVPGDGEIQSDGLVTLFRKLRDSTSETDMILAIPDSQKMRPLKRRLLSWLFVRLVNTIAGLKVPYYNGPNIIRRTLLCNSRGNILDTYPSPVSGIHHTITLPPSPLFCASYAYMAKIIARLVRQGATYTVMPFSLRQRSSGKSKALRLRSWVGVSVTLLGMVWDYRIRRMYPQRRRSRG